MAQFTDFDAYREAYFADPTANGPTAHPTGSAQPFDGQPSPQDATGFDAFLFNQSALGDGAFDGLVSNSAGVSGAGYIPRVEDMQNLAQLGTGSDLPSLQVPAHDTNTSQYAHTQKNIQTGRARSWSASSRESTMSATGNGSATLFPAIPPNQYFSASPNMSSIVPPESGTSHLLQGPYASHAEILQQQQRSSPIPGIPTQPKRMSTALRQRLATVQQPQKSVPSLASTARGQYAAPSRFLPPEPQQRKRRAHEPESDDPSLDTLGQRSRNSARSGQPAKRPRRGSAPSGEEAQPVDQMTMSTPFATPPFAPGFQHDFAVNSGPYYASGFPLAPIPEQDGFIPSAASEQQLLAGQPNAFHLSSTKTGSRRDLTPKMRQDIARMKAVRDRRLAARAVAAEPFAPSIPSPAIGQFTPVEGDQLAAAQYSGPYVATDNPCSSDDWLGRLLSDANRNMLNAGIGTSGDMFDGAANPSAISSEPVPSSSSGWEAAAVTPGPNGQVYFDPRFAGDYDYDGNFNFGIGIAPMSSVALPSTPIEADGSSGGDSTMQNAYPDAFHGFESCNFQHGTGCSSECPSHTTGTAHSHAFPTYKDFAAALDEDDGERNEDVGPVAESSKDAAKRASAIRGRSKSAGQPAKRGPKPAPAGRSASGKTPKSSGSRVQGLNTYTPANPPRLPVHLPEIVQGHTPCPFCQHPIRTALKNSVLPSMCQVKEHLFGYNDNPPCPALVYWVVSWPKGGDLVGVAIIGEIIVRQWPDEVNGTDEEEWFPYRMWGKKTGFGGELLKWWNGLSQERKDEILGKGKGE